MRIIHALSGTILLAAVAATAAPGRADEFPTHPVRLVVPFLAGGPTDIVGRVVGQGLTEMLLGSDPMDVEGIWDRLYVGSAMNGRRGVVVNAIGAIDMALHDLRGKALGQPCHELLGGAVKSSS